MREPTSGLVTVRQIASELGVPKHRVLYAMQRCGGDLTPAARASQTMLFDPGVIPVIRAILKGLAANRGAPLRFAGFDEERAVR
jgi:hypothetical protein